MKRIAPVLAVAALALLLGACGLIPAQTVADPLGIGGEEVIVGFAGGAVLAAQAVAGTGTASFQFDNGEGSRIPLNPARITAPAGFAATAVLSGGDGPETITLSDPQITVRIWEGSATYAGAADEDKIEVSDGFTGPLELSLDSCTTAGAVTTCSYAFDSDVSGLTLIELTGGDLRTFRSIVEDGPTTNYGEVEVALQGSPDSLAGRTLALTVEGGDGEVSF